MNSHVSALTLLKALGPDHPYLKQALAALDMQYQPPKSQPEPVKIPQEKPVTDTSLLPEQTPDFTFPITVVTKRQLLRQDDHQSALQAIEDRDALEFDRQAKAESQPLPPLWQEKALYQALLPFFHQPKTSRQPDIVKIIRHFERKLPLTKLPNKISPHFPSEIWLYCDYTDGASVYHNDYQMVQQQLKTWFGDKTVSQTFKLQQRSGEHYWHRAGTSRQFSPLSPPAGAMALILAPATSWRKPLWSVLDQHLKAAETTSVYLSLGALEPHLDLPVSITTRQLDKLMAVLSLCPSVLTLAMIRQLRIELIKGGPELEAQVANHDNIQWYQSDNSGFWRHGIVDHQARANKLLTQQQQTQAYGIIAEHLSASDECWQRQHQMLTLLHCSLPDEINQSLDESIGEYFGDFGKRLLDKQNPNEVEWLMIQGRSLGEQLINLPEVANKAFTLTNLLWQQQSGRDEQLPGVDPAVWQQWHQTTQTTQTPDKPATIRHLADGLHICPPEVTDGVSICTVTDTASLLVQPPSAKQAQRLITQVDNELTITNREQALTLETFASKKFYWADSLSITADGVVATTDFLQLTWPAIGNDLYDGAVIEILDDAPDWLYEHPPQLDDYGLFVELVVKGAKKVSFKLRYIPPGSFLMGSPENEVGRDSDDEPQHPVTMNQGYWLGETTVSQRLWQTVTGNTPSQFKGKQLPVESVSWDDCQQFCQQLNELIPGLTLALPTEAQWEYACRADTQTAYSTGQALTKEQANFGEMDGKTVVVNSFAPNDWGLLQMHGNVWEWCQGEKVTDPKPRDEQPLRGGSWIGFGRGCRSACRVANGRGVAIGDVGLRVTQVLSSQSYQARERADPQGRPAAEQGRDKGKASDAPASWLDLAEIDNRRRWQQRPPKSFPSRWANEWGFDNYGLWQCFIIKGIRCKMRYIPPGSFLMGSPESEAGRFDNETQHEVTLTQGFWLGETTVTQQLWQAVMGNNPSRIEGEQLPVETVTWDDCQQFCRQIIELISGLVLTLPTEAQWEYACRAGTETPFSTGQELTKTEANYDSDKTMAVDAFAPNAWGLKQMHGNVDEWCQDDVEVNSEQRDVRPLRGGSWINSGRICRSAYRCASGRGDASYIVGLRVTQVL